MAVALVLDAVRTTQMDFRCCSLERNINQPIKYAIMKRIFVAAFALLAMATTASAQNYEVVNDSVAAETTKSGASILAQLMDNAITEVPAAYPGGYRQLMTDLAANLEYPTIAIESDLQGRVLLQFVVTRQGKIGEVKVLKSLSRECDAAAIKAVRKLRTFTPARHKGSVVSVKYTLPVTFRLQ